MAPGQSYAVSVTLQNTGGTSWGPGTYYLASMNPQDNVTWGLNRVDLATSVAAGTSVTLSFNVTAPATAGIYNLQWQMTQGGVRFGAATPNVPVNVTATAAAGQLYYIHTDHLDTPRVITDQAGNEVWRWDNTEPFGDSVPNDNPSGFGAFGFSLRNEGQYADQETGLFYNVMRNYSSGIGGYIEADPAGRTLYRNMAMTNLGALGVVHPELIVLLYSRQPRLNHLYAYVGSNPLSYTDPLGLIWPIDCYECFKKQNEMEDALKECKKEYDGCKTLKDQIEFIEKYGGGFVSSAIYNCATQKNPGTYGDMIKSCGACGVSPRGPWPLKKMP
jgi:RHS repeat-associated protein